MPIIKSSYTPPFYFKNTHFNTIYKTLFIKGQIAYHRERIPTPDNDFLDLDFSTVGSKTLVIAMHGLEGSSQSKYIVSVVNYLNSKAIDCLAANFRGCSGEDNLQLYSYNSGKTDDVNAIIYHVLNKYSYTNILLLGYSMGGNITLKYMGETQNIPSEIKGAVAISTPCNLEGSSLALSKWENRIYLKRFLRSLKSKSLQKLKKFPHNILNKEAILKANNFMEFDNAVTAPVFGFKNAQDYYTQSSSIHFIPTIQKPTLLINALDDTFLSENCYPFALANKHAYLSLETPTYGGHVGFNTALGKTKLYWSEHRIFEFIQHIIS